MILLHLDDRRRQTACTSLLLQLAVCGMIAAERESHESQYWWRDILVVIMDTFLLPTLIVTVRESCAVCLSVSCR